MDNIVDNRFVLFPIKHIEVWNMYKKAVSSFWTVEEIDLSNDKYKFLKLDKDTQYFIKNVLAFFAASDGIVLENLAVNLLEKFQEPEIRCFYGFQIAMENIHSEMYSKLIDTYIDDDKEKDTLLRSIENIPSIKKKADWALKWINLNKTNEYIKKIMDNNLIDKDLYDKCKEYMDENKYDEEETLAKILTAFACVEGIFFSGSFCCIYWLRSQSDPLPALSISNDFIARDEGLHTDFACLLYNKFIKKRLDENIIYEMIKEAVDIESEFILYSLPCKLLGMNSDLMQTYIKFVADRLLIQLGYKKLFKVEKPFDFMDRICLESKTNFFEHRPTEYGKFVNKIDKTNENIYIVNGIELTNNF